MGLKHFLNEWKAGQTQLVDLPEKDVPKTSVDASKEFKAGRAQNELLPEHIENIHHWYRDYKDVEGVARVVTLEEIAANDHNLNIPRYVEPTVTHEALTVEEAMARLKRSARMLLQRRIC